MCLILFGYKAHENYKLVIAANRDEFYERKTAPASHWEDHPSILGGRDLEGGGTWMGVTKQGRISMLTNYRDLRNLKKNAPTRGKLVSDFLLAGIPMKKYLETVDLTAHSYNGYNIVLGTIDDIWYYSNESRKIYMLGSGIYGLSNALLDTPWPKVKKGKAKLKEVMKSSTLDPEVLMEVLQDDEVAEDAILPETGVGLEMERMLSSMFIKSPKYGTRCSTVILVDQDNNIRFSERTYNTSTFEYETRSYNFAATP